jgi:hypothetical protein
MDCYKYSSGRIIANKEEHEEIKCLQFMLMQLPITSLPQHVEVIPGYEHFYVKPFRRKPFE